MPASRALQPPPSLSELMAHGRVSLFLDFDGTLVEIASTPGAIEVPTRLNPALCALSNRLEGRLALVSGRAILDLETHLGPIPIARAGSHGIDRQSADGRALGRAPVPFSDAVRREVSDFAAQAGFDTEDKPHGAALHCRSRPELEEQGVNFARALAERHGLLVKRGKAVIELVAPGADKGAAVRAFMQAGPFAGSTPFFVGDDVTDEDGFAAVQEFGGAGILVGERDYSRAKFRLADPSGVHEWLNL